MRWAGLWLVVLMVLAGCPDEDANVPAPVDVGTDNGVPMDTADGVADAGQEVHEPETKTIEVPEGSCCIGMSDEWIVWAQGGDLWTYNRVSETTEVLFEDDWTQKDPVLDGTLLVWADNRNGNFDLFQMDLNTKETGAVVEELGDQHSPSLSNGVIVYVDQPDVLMADGNIDTTYAEIWMRNVVGDEPSVALTQDTSEQRYPDIHGSKVVWSDFRNDPEGHYQAGQAVANNNGDVFGYDLDTQSPIVVTTHEAKQLRPAVDGDTVVWLDWRHSVIGIEPLPKYDDFQVYAFSMASQVEVVLAGGKWKQPDLWRRPVLEDGLVAWIVEDRVNDLFVGTSVKIANVSQALAGGPNDATNVVQVDGILTAVDMMAGSLSWIGGGQVGVASLNVLMEQVGQ